MVTKTYEYYYTLTNVDLSGETFVVPYIAPNPGPTTLADTQDGTDDGILAIGGQVAWTAITNSPSELVAVTSEGYPILTHPLNGGTFMLTPVDGLHSQQFTMNKTDDFAFCFAAGTQISTPDGERSVETLEIGDFVTTQDGRSVPVLWLGAQTVHTAFSGHKGQLVRIRAGALGAGVPHSDLVVTGDHGMILEGLVINASALVNGDTVDWVPMSELEDSYTVYHIETEAHDVILANGAASESFIDAAGRKGFDNYAQYLELYGAERLVPEMNLPRASSARLLPEHIKQRMGTEAALLMIA